MSALTQELNRLDRALEPEAAQPQALDVEKLANACLQPLIPLIRGYLSQNLADAGFGNKPKEKRKSGEEAKSTDKRGGLGLEEAVSQAKVWCRVVGGELVIRFGLKPGLPERVYAAAGALQYGAVRGAAKAGIHPKHAKNLKKKALGTDNANKRFGGGVSVTKAYNFFRLSQSQADDVIGKLLASMAQQGS